MTVILETQAGIHQQESPVRLDHQAYGSYPAIGRPGQALGKTINDPDTHRDI